MVHAQKRAFPGRGKFGRSYAVDGETGVGRNWFAARGRCSVPSGLSLVAIGAHSLFRRRLQSVRFNPPTATGPLFIERGGIALSLFVKRHDGRCRSL